MEIESNHLIVFDACSIINLLYIDYEHQEIFRLLDKYFDFYIPQKVQQEIRINAFKKIREIKVKTNKDERLKEDLDDYLNQKIGRFWSNVIQDVQIEKDLGQNIYDDLSDIIGSKEDKGEWYCVAHSLYLSRICQSRLAFFTDDFPAKEKYSIIFKNQRVGLIEDTSDLLILLYWNCPEINEKKVRALLRDLYVQYDSELKSLLNEIRAFRERNFEKINPKLRNCISGFQHNLENIELDNLNTNKDEIIANSRNYKKVLENIFDNHAKVFELNSDKNLLTKIGNIFTFLDHNNIFKF